MKSYYVLHLYVLYVFLKFHVCECLGNVQKITQYQYLIVKQISFSRLSLNIRGLRDKFKRKKLLNWFKKMKHIILLQEIYSSIKIEEQWKLDWGGVIFSHESNHSKGYLISVNNNVDFKLIKEETGNDGR